MSVIADRLPLLLIEDEASVQLFLRSALNRHGFDVVLANNGVEGIEWLKSNDYTAIISDMRMPGGVSGRDIYLFLRDHRPELLARLLFITGDVVNEETNRVLRETGIPWLEKPFRIQDLIAALEKRLEA